MMKNAFAYLDEGTVKAEPSTLSRCFRVAQIVATLWTLAGSAAMWFALNSATPSPKARLLGIGFLLISAGIYSLRLPLWYVLKRSPLARDL